MEPTLTASDIDQMIGNEKKRYGKALGHLLGNGIGDSKTLAELIAITARYENLTAIRRGYLTPVEPAPVQDVKDVEPEPVPEEKDDNNGLPDGICNSESCMEPECLDYWEEVEGGSNSSE